MEKQRKLKIIGDGDRHSTRLIDADTGEDVGRQLGVTKISYEIGAKETLPSARVTLEIEASVSVEIEEGKTQYTSSYDDPDFDVEDCYV